MKRILIVLAVLPLFWACVKVKVKPQKTYKQKLVEQKHRGGSDTTFLNFIFGSNKQEVQRHIKKLQKTNRIGTKKVKTFYGGIKGYRYKMKIDKNAPLVTILSTYFEDGKLVAVILNDVVVADDYRVKTFLEDAYGKPTQTQKINSVKSEYYWLKNNEQILYNPDLDIIAFMSIPHALNVLNENEKQDSIKREALRKEEKQTKKDFQ